MPSFMVDGSLRKFYATIAVLLLVGGVQWFIHLRTRPPEPGIQFPKELRDIPP